MVDQYGRDISYLRVSLTDRCNLRCRYCMPEEGVEWLDHSHILTYEQLLRLASLFARLGVRHIRLTGGEPLVRRGVPELVAKLKQVPGIDTVTLTTNGVLLASQLPALVSAGLDGINLSLDTLDRGQYQTITRRDMLPQALEGLEAALAQPHLTVKVNCVPMGENDDQLIPLARLAQDHPLAVRFIELMPIGLGDTLPRRTQKQVMAQLEEAFGPALPAGPVKGLGPARYMTFPGFRGQVGFISALSHQFCHSCNRVRLTATGFLKTCLQYDRGADLKELLETGADDQALLAAIQGAIQSKPHSHHFSTPHQVGDEPHAMHQIGG